MSKQIKLRMPSYYKQFQCTADKCSDNCCIGWEIDIDSKTYEYYKSIKGEFGDRLKSCISDISVPHFILNNKERCPFLNESNLCDIYINLGENNLCGICTEHPRYYEWYNGLKEGGVGLCCESAAKLIVSQQENFSYYEISVNPESCDEYDQGNFEFLFKIRENILEYIHGELPLYIKINDILIYAEKMQNNYDNFSFETASIEESENISVKTDIVNILKSFASLELLSENNLFEKAALFFENNREEIFINKSMHKAFENIFIYFVWRHFLKSVYEEEFYSKIAFAALSTAVVALLCFSEEKNFSEEILIKNAVYYSKEIEYNESNLNRVFDSFYENDEFSLSKISSLFKFFQKI